MKFRLSLTLSVFILGVAQALATIWVMLGFMPVIVPVVERVQSFALWALLSLHLLLAVSAIICARSITISGWQTYRKGAKGKPDDLKFLDGWFLGTGLMMFLMAIVTPPMLGALVIISPWMGIVAVAATGIAIKGLMGWSNSRMVMGSVAFQKGLRSWPKGLISAVAALVVSVIISPYTYTAALSGIDTAILQQVANLKSAELDLERLQQVRLALEPLLDTKVRLESQLEAQERVALGRGASSEAAAIAAEAKVTEAKIQRINSLSSVSDGISRHSRDIVELRARVKALQSAAPGLTHR
jgi:hypothetical protein